MDPRLQDIPTRSHGSSHPFRSVVDGHDGCASTNGNGEPHSEVGCLGTWLVVDLPKMLAAWDYSQYMEEPKNDPNHQPGT